MKIEKIVLVVCSIVLILSLTGCQLAKEELAEGKTRDRLVGVFITNEYLDLFDNEGYLNDNLNGFSGGEIKLNGETNNYNGRLYATLSTKEHLDEDKAEKYSINKYTFDDVEGIQFFTTETPSEDNNGGTLQSNYMEGMTDCNFGVYCGDDEDKITLDGTVYFVAAKGIQTHYINPVYQSPDGRIYTMTGDGISVEGTQSEGFSTSRKMEESITVSENGKSKKKTVIINVSIESMLPPQKIVLWQMDKNSNVLLRQGFQPGKLPDRITPDSATEYIILESYKTDFQGKEKVERNLFTRNNENIDSFYATSGRNLIKQYTAVSW